MFQVICIDPPYQFSDKLSMSDVKRGAEANYSTLTLQELKELPIDKIADPEGCVLAIWCPSSLIKDGLELMDAYGFQCKQSYVWVKTKKQTSLKKLATKDTLSLVKKLSKSPKDLIKEALNLSFKAGDWLLSFGLGRLFRQVHEICLIGINNTKIYTKLQNKSQRSVCFAENTGHSTKPENLQDSLELMFPDISINKIELFARRERKGWVVLGNEVGSKEDIRVSLKRLINV
jgi:N6-adenosine-specific RNA methylase IME4